MWQCHITLSTYMVSYCYIQESHLSLFTSYSHSECFLLSLIIRPKITKIAKKKKKNKTNDAKMNLSITRPKTWALPLVPTSPKFHFVSLYYDRLFGNSWGLLFLHNVQWWIWQFFFKKKSFNKNWKLKILKIPIAALLGPLPRKVRKSCKLSAAICRSSVLKCWLLFLMCCVCTCLSICYMIAFPNAGGVNENK